MSWITLDESAVLTRITGPESDRLQTAARAPGQTGVLAEVVGQTVNEWRGAIRRHHPVNIGQTIPDELAAHVLADIRHRLVSRLPGLKALMDESREREWREARRVIDRLEHYVIGAPDDPETAAASGAGSSAALASSAARRLTRQTMDGL